MHPLNKFQDPLALIGRVLIAMLFIPGGIGKLMGFAGTVGYIASKGVPLPEVCAAIAVIVELGLGVLLLVGFQTRWAALAIALFTLVITFIFHAYWGVPPEQVMAQKMNFFKNMAIVGGLFAFACYGAGRFSIDGRKDN
ncbi:MAG: DoxX family protein [Bdellovibrionales bacterium]|nr:DoxX family protein [Ramlibacter sp.]